MAPLSESPTLIVHFSQPARHLMEIKAGQIVEFQFSAGFVVQKDGPWNGSVEVDADSNITFDGADGQVTTIRTADLG